MTIIAFLPPSSSETRFSCLPALEPISRPTAEEPVNEITGTSLCSTNCAPTLEPMPHTMFSTLGGTPASSRISISFTAVAGVSCEGLNTTVLPQIKAGKIFQVGIAMGKFHGVIIPHTPIGQ